MDIKVKQGERERTLSASELVDDLFLSVTEGWTNRVARLLSEDVAKQTFYNLAPSLLHKAAGFGHHDILELLLSFGAVVDSRNAQHLTALHVSANGGFDLAVRVLLDNGADVNTKCIEGRTPLYYATYSGSLESVKEMLNHNADMNLARRGGWTPLHEACRFGFVSITKYLLQCGADADRKTEDACWTPGHMAASNGHVECLKLLINKGVNVNAAGGPDHMSTLLHEACYAGHLECVEQLLESGADATLSDGNKELALHLVARRGHGECLLCLIKWYKDHNMANIIDAYPAFDVLNDKKEFEHYPYEIQKTLNTALHLSAAYGHRSCVEILLDNGAHHLSNGLGLYPVVLCALQHHVSCIRVMLDRDPDIVINSVGRYGFNPLHYLCMKTHGFSKEALACACILINSGAGVNDAPEHDSNLCPLAVAARNGAKELVQLLLLNGASPYITLNTSESMVGNMGTCATLIERAQFHARPLIHLARMAIRKHLGYRRLKAIFTLPLAPMFQNFLFHGHGRVDGLCNI